MDEYVAILAVIGFALLGMAWMPSLTKRIKISYSIVYVLLGVAIYSFFDFVPNPDPLQDNSITVRLTELMVIISLMGTGLKIDDPFSIKTWKIPLRLVSITMLLSIACVALIGFGVLGLSLPSAILLGAVLAPTDPVLADDVQVGPPLEKSRNEVRFSLTAEAGLNDGMAFPFTWLAVTLALIPANEATLTHWFLYDVAYRIISGVFTGFLIGRALAWLLFHLPGKAGSIKTQDGFVALSSTLLVYGVTELIHGYGFVAVFVCAVTVRNYELEHEYHLQLHSFTDQVERMLMAIVLILFGGTLWEHVFPQLTFPTVLFAIVLVLVVRPLTAYVSVIRTQLHQKERWAISFYGIKGIGSLFYLAFAIKQTEFAEQERLWSLVSLVILSSIVIHGISASIIMTKIEKQFSTKRKS